MAKVNELMVISVAPGFRTAKDIRERRATVQKLLEMITLEDKEEIKAYYDQIGFGELAQVRIMTVLHNGANRLRKNINSLSSQEVSEIIHDGLLKPIRERGKSAAPGQKGPRFP